MKKISALIENNAYSPEQKTIISECGISFVDKERLQIPEERPDILITTLQYARMKDVLPLIEKSEVQLILIKKRRGIIPDILIPPCIGILPETFDEDHLITLLKALCNPHFENSLKHFMKFEDPDSLFDNAVDYFRNNLGLIFSSLLVMDQNIQGLHPLQFELNGAHKDSALFSDQFFPVSENLLWKSIEKGEVILKGNKLCEMIPQNLKDDIWLPLKYGNSLIGVATFHTEKPEVSVSPAKLRLLEKAGIHLAAALKTTLLSYHSKKTHRKLDRQMFNLSVLFNVGKAMNFINDLTRLLKLILDKSIEVCKSDKGSLMLWDDESEDLAVRVVRGLDPEIEEKIATGIIKPKRIKRGEGIAGRVFQTGNHILVNDTSTDERFMHARDSRVSSILCVPLKTQKDCIGVINISNKEPGKHFDPDDVELLMNLAGQAAVVIDNARLYEMAITDGMTGLFIHRYFQQQLEVELRRSRRYSSNLSLIMTDIDHFKNFNDTYGHQAGDYVLKEVASAIKRSCRDIDIVARYGGEEFAVICPETDVKGALILAERLRTSVQNDNYVYQDQKFKVTISVGVATYPRHNVGENDLVKAADKALYKAKRGGRNRSMSFGGEPIPNITSSDESNADETTMKAISEIITPETA